MLPLILGIGAAALLLGRKAVKRAGTRSNPRKQRAVRRQAKRNPVTPYAQSQRARFGDYLPLARAIVAKFKESLIYARAPAREVFKQNVARRVTEEMGDAQSGTALHIAKIAAAQAMREVLENAQRRGMKVNPSRRRKGKRVSVDQAASRLAWWRWHHNPADSVWRLVKVHPRRGFAQRHPVWEFEHKRTGERRRIVQSWRGPAPAGWPHLPETNPSRRRKGKRVSVDQAASRLAWWRWHHNPRVTPGLKAASRLARFYKQHPEMATLHLAGRRGGLSASDTSAADRIARRAHKRRRK